MINNNEQEVWMALDSIMACNSFDRVRENILNPLTDLVSADGAVYLEMSRRSHETPVVNQCFFYGNTGDFVDDYICEFCDQDPLIYPVTRRSDVFQLDRPKRVRLKEDGRSNVSEKTKYYRDFVKAIGLNDVLGAIFPMDTESETYVCIGIQKYSHCVSDGPEYFLKEDCRALERLIQPLNRVFHDIYYKRVGSQLKALVAMLNYSSHINYVLLDDQLHILQSSVESNETSALLMPGSSNLRNLKSVANNLYGLLSGDFNDIWHETMCLKGFGKVKLSSSKNEAGELNHLLLWGDGLGGQSVKQKKIIECTAGLTRREQDLVDQLTAGKSNKQIAHELNISIRTVENHLRSIYQKMGVHSRAQLVHNIYGETKGGPDRQAESGRP